jgi:phenylalanyl-tRNA synthetase beta chain
VKNQNDVYAISVPSWRDTGDITLPEDIVEEVARHVGYETIDGEALPGPLSVVRVQSHDTLTMKIASFFAGRGYLDAYTYPFTLAERFEKFSDSNPAIIQNTSENRTHLRAHIAESLLELVMNNYRTHDEGAFFEF